MTEFKLDEHKKDRLALAACVEMVREFDWLMHIQTVEVINAVFARHEETELPSSGA